MFKKLVLSVPAILYMAVVSLAQMLPCSTDQHYWNLVKKYPQLEAYQQQFDDQLDKTLANERNSMRTTSATDNTIYDIPLVIHVIHDYGVENISDDDLYTAAAYWAVVYMKHNADTAGVIPPFIPYIGNPDIRLHLATIDPNGNPTKGIVRFQSYLTGNADDQAKYNQWPPSEYVNIWFVNAFGAEDAGAAAYAYFPSSFTFQPYYDGVISLYSYSDPSTKAIPHELGHVLNLYHPWGNTNSPGVACGGTDKVDDTPPTKGHLPSGCTAGPLYDTACATGYMVKYKSVLTGADSVVDYPDTTNAQNIMDYTYCQEMFTKGQVVRMRTALLSATAGRNNLTTPANLALTGALAPMPDLPPVADYIVGRAVGVAATDARSYFLTFNNTASFSFHNESWNDTVSGVSWTFSNGATSPASTSMTTVNNQFSTPGWVTVSLTANSNAGSNTITNTNAVYVADTAVAGTEGYEQQFASPSDISNWPMFNYYNNQFKWEFYTGAGYDGDNTCIRYRSYDTSKRITGTALGDHDDIYTPAFDLRSNSDSEYINFFTSAASTTHGISSGTAVRGDSMQVQVSINGGAAWAKIATYYGSNLANNGSLSADFIPTSPSQWQARAINVPNVYRTANTFLRIRYWPGNEGNNLYLDNFYIYQFPAGVKEALSTAVNSFNVFPNPAANGCNLVFRTGNDGVVSYCVKDITGKLIYKDKKVFASNSIQQEVLPRSVTPSAGMYFVTITIDGMNTTQKLVVY